MTSANQQLPSAIERIFKRVTPPDYWRKPGTNHYHYLSYAGTGTLATQSPAIDVLYAYPVSVPRTMDISGIGCRVASAGGAGNKVRVGIYKDDGTIYPGEKYAESAEFDGTDADVHLTELSARLFNHKLYWLVFHQGGGTVAGITSFSTAHGVTTLGVNAGSIYLGYKIAQAYAALPSEFPAEAGASFITSTTELAGIYVQIAGYPKA
jgi:hypothetical protein